MALGSFLAGAYTGTYNSGAMGITDRGYLFNFSTKGEEIAESDQFGLTLIDGIYRGMNVASIVDCKEFKDQLVSRATVRPFHPFAPGLGILRDATHPIGQLWSNAALAMVLTVTANTPAALGVGGIGTIITTLTAPLALIAPNNDLGLLFNSELRKVPLRFNLLPSDSAGTTTHFQTT